MRPFAGTQLGHPGARARAQPGEVGLARSRGGGIIGRRTGLVGRQRPPCLPHRTPRGVKPRGPQRPLGAQGLRA
eukprot:2060528-Pyramimonas_sp.AAC.1